MDKKLNLPGAVKHIVDQPMSRMGSSVYPTCRITRLELMNTCHNIFVYIAILFIPLCASL